jgi:hypothetical protein
MQANAHGERTGRNVTGMSPSRINPHGSSKPSARNVHQCGFLPLVNDSRNSVTAATALPISMKLIGSCLTLPIRPGRRAGNAT